MAVRIDTSGSYQEKVMDYKTVVAIHLNRLNTLSFLCCQDPKLYFNIWSFRSGIKQFETILWAFIEPKHKKMIVERRIGARELVKAQSSDLGQVIEVFDKLQIWQGNLLLIAYQAGLIEAKLVSDEPL